MQELRRNWGPLCIRTYSVFNISYISKEKWSCTFRFQAAWNAAQAASAQVASQAVGAAQVAQAAAASEYSQAAGITHAAQAATGAAFAESANAAQIAATVQSAKAFKQWAQDQVNKQ